MLIIVLLIWIFSSIDDSNKFENNTHEVNSMKNNHNLNEETITTVINNENHTDVKESNAEHETKEITIENNEYDRFQKYILLLKEKTSKDDDYTKIIFNLGILYEKLYRDFFRATCYVYLATIQDNKNKEYEKEYIRLCNILTKEKGDIWTYYVTLANCIDDIEKYNNQLLPQVSSQTTTRTEIKSTRNNTYPKTQRQKSKFSHNESKF